MSSSDGTPEFNWADHSNLTTPTEYRLTGYRQHETHRGTAWSGRLTLRGEPIGEVSNDGNGGATFVHVDANHTDAFTAETATRYPKKQDAFTQAESFGEDLATLAELSRARGITFAEIDTTNGLIANRFCPAVARETFLAGTEPGPCNEHGGLTDQVTDWWNRLKGWFRR